jgi:uncharacterized membrane protein
MAARIDRGLLLVAPGGLLMAMRLLGFLLVGSCLLTSSVRAQCEDSTCLSAGTRPITVSLPRANMLDAVLSSLLGVGVDLAPGDYEALATADLALGDLIAQLQADLTLGSPMAVLNAAITLEQLLDAAASVAASNGDALASASLAFAADEVALGATGTIQLGDLLEVELRAELLDVCSISALDLLTGGASLFNTEHATTVADVTVSGSALGLGAQIASIELGVVATEPPVYACGEQGSSLSSSGLRLRTSIDLVDTDVTLGVAGLAAASLTLASLDLVTEVTPGTGTLEQIDALASTLRVDATPGVVGLYLGTISDADLLSASPIDPELDIDPATVAELDVTLIGGIIQTGATVTARAVAGSGAAPETMLSFTSPYPKTLTAELGADLGSALADDLLADLEIEVGALTPPPPLPLGDGVLADLVDDVVDTLSSATGLLAPVLESMIEQLIDPLLETLGGGLGQLSVSVCLPFSLSGCDPDAGVDAGEDAGDPIEDAGLDGAEPEPDASEPEPMDASSEPDAVIEDDAGADAAAIDDGAVMMPDDGAVALDGEIVAPIPDGSLIDSGDDDDDSDEDPTTLRLRGGGCAIAAVAPNRLVTCFWLVTIAGVLLARRMRRLR